MLDRCSQTVSSLLLLCLSCLVVISVVTADGRVFVLDLRNSSGLQGFRDAEQACASQQSRLASAEELRHAVEECVFSLCTHGWLHGGTVGTTVCNTVGSALKAVEVRTENVTVDTTYLDAFCIKDRGVPCGDPPSFPNARLQGHSGLDMADELLYTCVPGYVMPSGHSAFSLVCDSCGEWYGLVQICVKDETETHIDYEDKYTDSYEEEGAEQQPHSPIRPQIPEEAHGEVYEEIHGAANSDENNSQEQQETSYGLVEYQDQHGEHDVEGEKDRAIDDFVGHPTWEQEKRQVVRINGAAATEAPVSLLSQKHMIWFPSEVYQEEVQSVSSNQDTKSEESKEHECQERHQQQHHDDADDHDLEPEGYGDHGTDGRDEHDDSQHYEQDDRDSQHHEDDQDDVKQHVPEQPDDLDRWDHHDNDHDDHSDHYDMGEHEDDRVHYDSREYHERDDTYAEHESYENHKDKTDGHGAAVREHPEVSQEHPDHDDHDDDGEEQYDLEDNKDSFTDHDDHVHDNQDSYDDHDSHEDVYDDHPRIIFAVATGVPQNVTKKGARGKATTDETWLDGYPVIPEGAKKGESTTESVKLEHREKGTLARTTERPSEVDIRRPVPDTISPGEHESPTVKSVKSGEMEVWLGFIHTAAPYPELLEPSDSPSYSDTLDYDTQQPAPTDSWHGDLTEHPFIKQGPAPPVHDNDILSGVMEEHNLPGEAGERGEMEGEGGETICLGDNCPPHPPSSSLQGPTVTAIIVAVCVIAAAVVVGVWCYRRQQQKSSMYEMNGKGQSHTRHGQQIEMQQKV